MNYIGLRNSGEVYYFKDGLKIKMEEGVDAATIVVIFIKKEYGKVRDSLNDWKHTVLVYIFKSTRMKDNGKPYDGKPHVWFDEELVKTPALYSTGRFSSHCFIERVEKALRKGVDWLAGLPCSRRYGGS